MRTSITNRVFPFQPMIDRYEVREAASPAGIEPGANDVGEIMAAA